MSKLFGTDGVRGIANTELNCELAINIARATSTVVVDEIGRFPKAIVGTDTRISAGMLTAAINAGLASVGASSINIGVVPTPAVSYLVSQGYADIGFMISASHNPYDYNGIKIFGAGGLKLTDEQEFEIEKIIYDKIKPYPTTWGQEIGRISYEYSMSDHYLAHLEESVKDIDFTGFNIAVDCSNGSASGVAPKLFKDLGINATFVNCSPDGININANCGSTHRESLSELVKGNNFDCGFAFDGDADRCLMVDENGKYVDGDEMMAILAMDLKDRGLLKNDTLVATVMSNMGLFRFGKDNGINVETTKVGDRYVLEKILDEDYTIGGEQSGHVILHDYMATGDGMLTALHMLAAMVRKGEKLSQMASIMTVYPQVMINFKANTEMKSDLFVDEGAQKIIKKAEDKLGEDGRILVRPSGTEPLIRVMVEGRDIDEIQLITQETVDSLKDRLNLIQKR